MAAAGLVSQGNGKAGSVADGSVTFQLDTTAQAAAKQQQQPVQATAAAVPAKKRKIAGLAFPKARTVEGVACLLVVALLWGSYGPALRIAYNMPGGPTPVAVASVSALIELFVLLSIVLARFISRRAQPAAELASPPPAQTAAPEKAPKPKTAAAVQSPWVWLPLPVAVLAGLEIGLYNALANCAEIGALALTTATRSAFLIQASILFVPILSSFSGMAPSRSVWVGSMLALVGTVIITQDPSGAALPGAAAALTPGGLGLAAGDILTLLAALFYSFATVRMPVWSVRYKVTPLQLALGKSSFLTAMTTTAACVCAARLVAAGQPVTALWPGWRQPAGWVIMLWAALGPGALASVLHVRGQSIVPPAPSRIILGGVPLWAALISAAVVKDEKVGLITCIGGSLIAAAGMTAAFAGRGAVKASALAAT